MPLESKIQADIIKALRADNCYVANIVVAGVAGTPDLIVCARGLFIALEVKTPKGRVTEVQRVQNMLIERAGGQGYVVRSVADARACIASALSGKYEV